MLFDYSAVDQSGAKKYGSIDAVNVDIAISSLQRRGMVVTEIKEAGASSSFLSKNVAIFDRVSTKDIVILSRQLSTLFEAQVSALRIFRLLAAETENAVLARKLTEVADDIQSGSPISGALAKHKKIFSDFYVSMVKAGEESGKLNETFLYLADYLDRSYDLSSRVKGALIYPAFVIVTFVTVMILMFTMVIPKISSILTDSGADIPIYTKVIMGISNFLVSYGFVLLALLVVGGFFLVRFIRTPAGRFAYDRFKLSVPYVSGLFRKLYLARMADNMATMLASGITMVRALELTSNVISNSVYKTILSDAVESVKGGKTLSDSLSVDPQAIPGIMTQMMKVGEESGELGNILKTVAKFYSREVTTAVDSLVSLIEPALIVFLGGGVAILLASVLIPIYNIASAQ
ncbi:type II secretion system F family protein [Patescibacteria group bacterium]|nr:type II secretion system F family protein [Patescibacteria group bacterium]MDE1946756.1 type II secretion system F family protein [Patescibacteria group bacterium]MDE2010941.1 type II secretion system F family protein [Patescibacteria group bacterium]MDE2233654.1 type II secretion system F family protein [Patescibacteria group bacterium]